VTPVSPHLRLRLQAVRSLRMNYTRRGTWLWLKGRKRSTGERGWRRVWADPQSVIDAQNAIAEGVCS
jgi:hypothetical protein